MDDQMQSQYFSDTGYGPVDEFGVPMPIPFDGIHAEPERRANRELFTLELEFVQALANPFYLYNLKTEGYLDKPEFINYLKYLQYWKKKEYARFVTYPMALHHLELLQHARFRDALQRYDTPAVLQHYQFEHWRTWRAKGRLPIQPENPSAPGDLPEIPNQAAPPGSAGPSTQPPP